MTFIARMSDEYIKEWKYVLVNVIVRPTDHYQTIENIQNTKNGYGISCVEIGSETWL